MKLNQKGALDMMLVAAIAVVLIVGGFVMYRISDTDDGEDNDSTSETSEMDESSEDATDSSSDTEASEEASEETTVNVSNDYFSMTLPGGWTENDVTADDGLGLPEAFFEFTDNSGRSIGVNINTLGFGGGGDGSASFEVVDGQISLDEEYSACDPEIDETGACVYGDGSLELLLSSATTLDGDNYIFRVVDENDESQSAYQSFAEIVETLEIN